MPEQVIINEVGPRDGLQSQSRILGVEQRLALIRALEQTGLARIEAGSFVSPKAVPAMADTDQLLSRLDTGQSLRHSFLIPNRKGFELALAAGAKSVTMVVYASETMAQKNARMTQAQAEAVARQIIAQAKHQQVEVILIIAVSFACPFDGATAEEVVLQMAARFADTPHCTAGIGGYHRCRQSGPGAVAVAAPDPTVCGEAARLPFPRYPRHGAGQYPCRLAGRCPLVRQFHRWPRRLPVCPGCQWQCRHRGCGGHVATDGAGNRPGLPAAAGCIRPCHGTDRHRPRRSGAGMAARCSAEKSINTP